MGKEILRIGWEELITKGGEEIIIHPLYFEDGEVFYNIIRDKESGIRDEEYVKGLRELFEGDCLYKYDFVVNKAEEKKEEILKGK